MGSILPVYKLTCWFGEQHCRLQIKRLHHHSPRKSKMAKILLWWSPLLMCSVSGTLWVREVPVPELRSGDQLPPMDWILQKLDHFSATDNRTWLQRYFYNDEYYTPGGPAFIYIGGERMESPLWIKRGHMMELVRRYNGTAFLVEHRYYGPSELTQYRSTESLKYLSSAQALADLAYFIDAANKKFGLEGSKWITYGGSYAGNLAVWMRQKYPHLIQGAIAVSAPVLAVVNFQEYYEAVAEGLKLRSKQCVEEIKEATRELNMLWDTENGTEKVGKLFKLCPPFGLHDIQEGTASIFADMVQGNRFKSDNITMICNRMLDRSKGNSSLERLASLWAADHCSADHTEPENIHMWTYQTCTEFGFFQTLDSLNQPFGNDYSLDINIHNSCTQRFGPRFNRSLVEEGVRRTNLFYGGKNPVVSNVAFVSGSLDPWTRLGVVNDLSTSAKAYVIEGASHCESMNGKKYKGPSGMTAVLEEVESFVGDWFQR